MMNGPWRDLKSPRRRALPREPSCSEPVQPPWAGEKNSASHPSHSSRRAMFFGPRLRGRSMSSRSGWIEDQRFPRPVPSGAAAGGAAGRLQRPPLAQTRAGSRRTGARERLRRTASRTTPTTWGRHPEPEDEAPAAQMVERHRRHRCGRRLAATSARSPPSRIRSVAAPPRQRRQAVRAIGPPSRSSRTEPLGPRTDSTARRRTPAQHPVFSPIGRARHAWPSLQSARVMRRPPASS
jgi:hypothetical protein